MPGMSKKDNDKQRKRFGVFILLFTIFFTITISILTLLIYKVRQNNFQQIEMAKRVTFNEIEKYIDYLYTKSKENSSRISHRIMINITKEYPNKRELAKLKGKLDTGDYSDLYKIINKSIENEYLLGVENMNNSLFVATKSIIICDLNYKYSMKEENGTYLTWADYINNHYNKKLGEKAAQALTTIPTSMVIVEADKSNIKGHKYYDTIDYDTLYKIYKKEGLEGLKNYRILTPSYIKNANTDIFDQNELTYGVQHETYRMIVIQRCSIYDQIMTHRKDLDDNSLVTTLESHNRFLSSCLYLLEITLMISFFITLLYICKMFNKWIEYESGVIYVKE